MGPVEATINQRRSLRGLDPFDEVKLEPRKLADALTSAAALAPSADNLQPWRFVSVYEGEPLKAVRESLSTQNQWASACSMFIVVCASPTSSVTGPSDSGKNGPVSYYLYDTGLASAFLMLRATDFGLIAHPIAGFDSGAVAAAIGLRSPSTLQIVAMIAIGQKSKTPAALARIPDEMRDAENTRPKRRPLEEIAFHNTIGGPAGSAGILPTEEERPRFDRDVILVNDDGKIYYIDQATLDAMTSVDEMEAEDQVAFGFIQELVNLGISSAAIPTLPQMNASIFCYLLNLGSLIPPKEKLEKEEKRRRRRADEGVPEDISARAATEVPSLRPGVRKRPHLQYSGCGK